MVGGGNLIFRFLVYKLIINKYVNMDYKHPIDSFLKLFFINIIKVCILFIIFYSKHKSLFFY
jgi:hypothetical protein